MSRALKNLIRLGKWRLDERRRILGDMERMRADFVGQAEGLEREVVDEQATAANGDTGISYGAYATGVIARRATIARSIEKIDGTIAEAREEVAEAFQELKKFEIALDRQRSREERLADRRAQNLMDELAIDMHRRRAGR